jgi:hypothetical protein
MYERIKPLRREERPHADVVLKVVVDEDDQGRCVWDAFIKRSNGTVDHVSGPNESATAVEAVDSGLACAQRNFDGYTTESGTYCPAAEQLAEGDWLAKVWKRTTVGALFKETPIYPSEQRHERQPQAFEEACAWAAALTR